MEVRSTKRERVYSAQTGMHNYFVGEIEIGPEIERFIFATNHNCLCDVSGDHAIVIIVNIFFATCVCATI